MACERQSELPEEEKIKKRINKNSNENTLEEDKQKLKQGKKFKIPDMYRDKLKQRMKRVIEHIEVSKAIPL